MRSPIRLLQKSDQLGIWVCFIAGYRPSEKRTLRVNVGEGYSKSIEVTSGVPQGSVVALVLFVLYINDYLKGLSCDAVMIEDDVKIWRTIESPSDVQRLHNDMN